MLKLLSRFYNEAIESLCTRILYFFNTINTYYLVAGIASYLIVHPHPVSPAAIAAGLLFAVLTAKLADFYPYFAIAAAVVLVVVSVWAGMAGAALGMLLLVNTIACIATMMVFMGIPDTIVSRDVTIAPRKLLNSIPTVTPTTVSLSMNQSCRVAERQLGGVPALAGLARCRVPEAAAE